MIEDELNELPNSINRIIERKCPCCEKVFIKEAVRYELRLDILPDCEKKRYRLYYKSNNYYSINFDAKYIGEHTGMGFKTIAEAIADLKTHLNE